MFFRCSSVFLFLISYLFFFFSNCSVGASVAKSSFASVSKLICKRSTILPQQLTAFLNRPNHFLTMTRLRIQHLVNFAESKISNARNSAKMATSSWLPGAAPWPSNCFYRPPSDFQKKWGEPPISLDWLFLWSFCRIYFSNWPWSGISVWTSMLAHTYLLFSTIGWLYCSVSIAWRYPKRWPNLTKFWSTFTSQNSSFTSPVTLVKVLMASVCICSNAIGNPQSLLLSHWWIPSCAEKK